MNTTTSSLTPSADITTLTDIIKELVLMNKANQQAFVKSIEETCVTCSGPHSYYECLATDGNTFYTCAAVGPYNQGGDVKAITTRSGVAYEGPMIPPTFSSLLEVVERVTEVTKDKVKTTNPESTAHVQPPVVQVPILEPDVAPKPSPKPSISYPSSLNDQKLREKTNNQMLNTTPLSDYSPSLVPFETSVSLLEEFTDELTLLEPFLPGEEDNNFYFKADLREIEYLLNQYPSTESNIETINPNLKNFIDEPTLDYSPPPGHDDDVLFDLKSHLRLLLYLHLPFENEDKVFNLGILILGGTQIFYDESKEKDLRDKELILEECKFLSSYSNQEILFFLELTVIETLLSFSSENKDEVFNPEIVTLKGVHYLTQELPQRTYETFKNISIHPNIFNEDCHTLKIEARVDDGQNHKQKSLQNLGNLGHKSQNTKHKKGRGVHGEGLEIQDNHGYVGEIQGCKEIDWEVVRDQRTGLPLGDVPQVSSVASVSAEGPIPPKTAEQKLARKNELKAKGTLMLGIPDEHLLKFHACKDANSLCEAIKNRFGGNKESKKLISQL
nr:reverse transcriptase domain-containing protein [Tanacetum cinerariifolium]